MIEPIFNNHDNYMNVIIEKNIKARKKNNNYTEQELLEFYRNDVIFFEQISIPYMKRAYKFSTFTEKKIYIETNLHHLFRKYNDFIFEIKSLISNFPNYQNIAEIIDTYSYDDILYHLVKKTYYCDPIIHNIKLIIETSYFVNQQEYINQRDPNDESAFISYIGEKIMDVLLYYNSNIYADIDIRFVNIFIEIISDILGIISHLFLKSFLENKIDKIGITEVKLNSRFNDKFLNDNFDNGILTRMFYNRDKIEIFEIFGIFNEEENFGCLQCDKWETTGNYLWCVCRCNNTKKYFCAIHIDEKMCKSK
jgi:hypothetical protein